MLYDNSFDLQVASIYGVRGIYNSMLAFYASFQSYYKLIPIRNIIYKLFSSDCALIE